MKSVSEPKYSVIDLFAGAGGLSCGFLQTGHFEIKAAFENNPNAQQTYRRNHENTEIYNDVADALTIDLGKIDVIIGGPPCQGFSNANRQKNHAVSRNNSLVKKFVQAVLHLNPIAFVMENVSMLQSNTHCFYVNESDYSVIEQYNIKTKSTEIHLLDAGFIFEGADDIAADLDKVNYYLWTNEKDYLILNVIYKTRKNYKKLKTALDKHKNKLLILAERLTSRQAENDHVFKQEIAAGNAIKDYFAADYTDDKAEILCKSIEPTIMLQRMFSKTKEIHENKIIVSEYSLKDVLTAKVKSMAVIDYIESILGAPDNGYSITKDILSAATFGVPQKRMRFVVMGVKKSKSESVELPVGTYSENNFRTVADAIRDIEDIDPSVKVSDGDRGIILPNSPEDISDLGRELRDSTILHNHVSTATTVNALKRFKAIRQGDNFHSLATDLKESYSDPTRTQNTIYLRLKYGEPSGTVVNIRKSMWIHPIRHRALSIREAARLQTFPDSFVFCGTKDSQYQQIGNAVPPILAEAIAAHLYNYLAVKK